MWGQVDLDRIGTQLDSIRFDSIWLKKIGEGAVSARGGC